MEPKEKKLGTTCKNGHASYREGCLACTELAMQHDEAARSYAQEGGGGAYEGPASKTVSEVIGVLVQHAGETGEIEGALEVVQRLSAFWRSKHGPQEGHAPKVSATPPPVCTGSGLSPVDITNSTLLTEGTCGICRQRVGVRWTGLSLATVVHPYYPR